jgi:hypothetical protein
MFVNLDTDKKRDTSSKTPKMKCMRHAAGHKLLVCRRNNISEEINTDTSEKKLALRR